MKLPLYQIDAFARRPFEGNPAAVCPLESWLDDATLQGIANENNLSETAYLVPEGDGYRLRWFTPAVEVALCGHATLASGHYILNMLDRDRDAVAFETLSGTLTVGRAGDMLAMDFPAVVAIPGDAPGDVVAAVGGRPIEALSVPRLHGAGYYMLVYGSQAEVESLAPDFSALGRAGANVIATARGDAHDFVSRFFAPASGINEDPVTGSAHCTLAPFWATKLGKTRLAARQVSPRGGDVRCTVNGERVELAGHCVLYMTGEIAL
jgi:predicted PhzF superfamily epimerase YddE/YHI9